MYLLMYNSVYCIYAQGYTYIGTLYIQFHEIVLNKIYVLIQFKDNFI